jgi:HPt (histidine-containing phosphotransfer) domain-containing protein
LKPLKLFLVDDKEAFKEILESFMTNTIESLNELEQAATESNFEEIKNIAHK